MGGTKPLVMHLGVWSIGFTSASSGDVFIQNFYLLNRVLPIDAITALVYRVFFLANVQQKDW